MATTLSELRGSYAARLTAAGVRCYGHVPERVNPPAAIVLPDEPYVSAAAGTQCGTFTVRHRVVLLGGKGTNERAADALDELIVRAVLELDDELEAVAEPAELELNGAGYLGTVLIVETLTEMEILP